MADGGGGEAGKHPRSLPPRVIEKSAVKSKGKNIIEGGDSTRQRIQGLCDSLDSRKKREGMGK